MCLLFCSKIEMRLLLVVCAFTIVFTTSYLLRSFYFSLASARLCGALLGSFLDETKCWRYLRPDVNVAARWRSLCWGIWLFNTIGWFVWFSALGNLFGVSNLISVLIVHNFI